jgi:hypothetical protein
MNAMILKFEGFERSLASANDVNAATLVRVINTGAAATLTVKANTGTAYANLTVANTYDVVVRKNPTDTLTGAGMMGVPVAYEST